MMMLRRIVSVAALAVLIPGFASPAFAAGQTVGDLISNFLQSTSTLPPFLSMIAYLMGISLATISIFKFKDHVDNPNQTPISAGVKRLLAGGMFLSLPFMTRVTTSSMFGDATKLGDNQIDSDATAGMSGAEVGSGAMDELMMNFISDIYGPTTGLLTAFSYIAGIAFLLVGISRLTKKMEEGPRGPAGFGTIMTFIASGALFSFGDTMGTFVNSLFGSRDISINASIDADVLADVEDIERVESVLTALMGFIMLVGFIAFMRGWFVLRNFADGQQGATLMQGLTFLIGGALAINLGGLINMIQATLGIAGLSFNT
jgi:intracellular multiplication protein IcmC